MSINAPSIKLAPIYLRWLVNNVSPLHHFSNLFTQVCNFKFARKTHLTRHKKTQHPELVRAERAAKAQQQASARYMDREAGQSTESTNAAYHISEDKSRITWLKPPVNE